MTHTFPSAHNIISLEGRISDHLGPLGVTRARANTIFGLAQKIVSTEIDFTLCMHPEAVIQKLLTIPGIGVWTAHYIAMRAIGWPDAFPHTDLGTKRLWRLCPRPKFCNKAKVGGPGAVTPPINLWNSLKA